VERLLAFVALHCQPVAPLVVAYTLWSEVSERRAEPREVVMPSRFRTIIEPFRIKSAVPTLSPPGGHALYLDAAALLPHLSPSAYPAQALAVELYRAGGVRTIEMGSVMFGRPLPGGGEEPATMELVRLALPRRVYTQSHIDYVAEVVISVASEAAKLAGFRITSQATLLRHFTARFEPLQGVWPDDGS
jgi:tryptophanase